MWRAIFHFCLATRMSEQLIRGGAFWAKISLTDRAFRIALDRNQLPVFVINELAATYAAIRTNRARDLRVVRARMHGARLFRHRLQPGAIFASTNLPNQRPFREQRSQRCHVV